LRTRDGGLRVVAEGTGSLLFMAPVRFLVCEPGRHAKTPGEATDGTCLAAVGGGGLKCKGAAGEAVEWSPR